MYRLDELMIDDGNGWWWCWTRSTFRLLV